MNLLNIQFKEAPTDEDLLLVALAKEQQLPILNQIDAALRFNIHREGFQGKKGQVLEMTTNGHHVIPRVILIGVGEAHSPLDWQEIGGQLALWLKGEKIAIAVPSEAIGDVAFGLKLRAWQFTKYLTQNVPAQKRITFLT